MTRLAWIAPHISQGRGARGERPVRLFGAPFAVRNELLDIPGVIYAPPDGVSLPWDAVTTVEKILQQRGLYIDPLPVPQPTGEWLLSLPGLERFKRLQPTLRQHQQEAAVWLAFGSAVGLGDEMRLMKSLSALAGAELANSQRTLIITPPQVKLGWAYECGRWLSSTAVILEGRAGDEARLWCTTCNGRATLRAKFADGRCPECELKGPQRLRWVRGKDEVARAIDASKHTICAYEILIGQRASDGRGKKFAVDHLRGQAGTLAPHRFDVAIPDECFPAGTLVGRRSIESIRLGDLVPSYDAMTSRKVYARVLGTFSRRPTSGLVRLHFEGGQTLVSTPDHPFMTSVGWRPASGLASNLVLCYRLAEYGTEAHAELDAEVCLLRNNVRVRQEGSARSFGDEADRPHAAGHVLAGVLQQTRSGGSPKHAGVPSSCAAPSHDRSESYAFGGDTSQTASDIESDRTSSADSGRERSRAPAAATAVSARLGGMGDRGSRLDGSEASQGGANELQDRHRAPRAEDRGRGRRPLARLSESPTARSKEDEVSRWVRVDRVEVLESGGDGRYGGLCPNGLVYNLEVEGTNTYIANGAVAHNCQKIRGFSKDRANRGQSIREHVNMVCDSIPAVWPLTGTLFAGFVRDAWGTLDLMTRGASTGKGDRLPFTFQVRYCGASKKVVATKRNGDEISAWEDKGSSPLAKTELPERLRHLWLARRRADVGAGLAPKTRTIVQVDAEVTPEIIRETRAALSSTGGNKSRIDLLRRSTAKVKMPFVADAIADDVLGGVKTIGFTFNPNSAKQLAVAVQEVLGQREHGPLARQRNAEVYLIVDDTHDRRAEVAARFREHEGSCALITTIGIMGEGGTNLAGAVTEHWLDVHHTPSTMRQAEDRPNALDRTHGLVIMYYVVPNSIDDHLIELVLPKLRTIADQGDAAAGDIQAVLREDPNETIDEALRRLSAGIDLSVFAP